MSIVSIRVPKELKRRMREVNINWSKILREKIEEVLEAENKKKVIDEVLKSIKGLPETEEGFSAKNVREDRDNR